MQREAGVPGGQVPVLEPKAVNWGQGNAKDCLVGKTAGSVLS